MEFTMSDDKNLTPMMKQYLQVKAEAPKDAVLLFRMGDFYEMFFNDAKIASPVLEIALTARAGSPMCGIPFHALDVYLPKLLEAGLKVAIAEQQEDPALAKGIVKRGITRVITPGSVIDGPLLKPGDNNFLCAFLWMSRMIFPNSIPANVLHVHPILPNGARIRIPNRKRRRICCGPNWMTGSFPMTMQTLC